MKKAGMTLHPSYSIGTISPRLFGAFLEPIGSMVNGSMYNPKHPTADEQGMRGDLIGALRKAGLPAVRLPGGNFVSGWNWKDSIGPMEQRKTNLDLAWHQFIPNDVGHDEYLQWAGKIGAEALYTVNLGTGSLNDARDIVEYTNFEGGTYWSDLRKKYGHTEPYGVKTWYLGNEMDGPWQIASWEKNPGGYGILAHEVSKAMKFVDPTIETVVCVSSSPFLNHYPEWDRKVLEECYDIVDMISLHHYHSAPIGDIPAMLAGYQAFESYINTEIALCDYMKTHRRSRKTMMLSFDEYGCSMRPAGKAHLGRNGRMHATSFYDIDPAQRYVHNDPNDWSTRKSHRDLGDMIGALGTASIMMTLMRHADRVKIGCATSGIGNLCATSREHIWRSAAYYPFTDMMHFVRGTSLMPIVSCDKYDVDGYAIDDMNQYEGFEDVEYIQCAAALSEDGENLGVFLLNSDCENGHELTLDLRGFEGFCLNGHAAMFASDISARNSYEQPQNVTPHDVHDTKLDGGICTAILPPLSWNVIRLSRAGK